ncbi:MAG: hypothetical protein DRI65_14960 [Chloroflexota bacterium]|nr:MAG: hypothetical protein DRI65_14960 [Chloroflexota bacterium]
MAQHRAILEAVLQSGFRHRNAGSKIAETVASIEAMVLSGIVTTEVVDSQDDDSIRRCRSAIAHKSFGKRMQDASETLDKIIADEALSLAPAEDQVLPGQHKQPLSVVLINSMNSRRLGNQFKDMADLQDKALDSLLVIYGAGGAKDNAGIAANLQAIKDA